ncbi:MAG: alpha-hydroxy-acid oxidizing protein [Planctomycetes bacterium]|nr:alpha-hydroxy-acid oxidizing protein [Planctomycetota bacterium]
MPDNVLEFEALARAKLDDETYAYLAGAADDGRTLDRNSRAFHDLQIRTRRMIDVTHIDTGITLLDESLPSPIILAPVGVQGIFHPEGELASARAAARRGHQFISATLSNHPLAEVVEAYKTAQEAGGAETSGASGGLWFQLYTSVDRKVSAGLLDQANACGCPVCVLTVDVPVLGNRESQRTFLERTLPTLSFGNLDPLGGFISPGDASLTWEIIEWIRQRTDMKLLLKGIVTREDAQLAIEHGVDGLIVSNHGGRQEESDRATIESLPEVAAAVEGRMPVILDSGIRRGTDIFKALALGASAVAIGRPYIWGLAAAGQSGVEQVLDILDAELIHIMRLAGTTSIDRITSECVMQAPIASGRVRCAPDEPRP